MSLIERIWEIQQFFRGGKLGWRDRAFAQESQPEGYELARSLIEQELDRAEYEFDARWHHGHLDRSSELLRERHGWRTALACVEETVEAGGPMMVWIDGIALTACFEELFANPAVETIVFLTGLDTGPWTQTVNRCIEVDHTAQSKMAAVGSTDGTFDVMRTLDETGHQLMAYAHNHPGTGPEATVPSETDRAYQRRLEAAGHTAVGLIFSEDGYVRAFANNHEFQISIQGGEKLDDGERLFRVPEPVRDAGRELV
jgi:hypothetical protein